jgi:hypothetical protein
MGQRNWRLIPAAVSDLAAKNHNDRRSRDHNDYAPENKYRDWKSRNWPLWLKDHLTFPFTVERKEDEDDAFFTDVAKHRPFRLGHIVKVIGIEPDDDHLYGIIVQVREAVRS